MIRGTTPTYTFALPFHTELIQAIEISFEQDNAVKLTKSTADCTMDEMTVAIKLTQEETFKFTGDAFLNIQIRILTTGNDVIASNLMQDHCTDSISNEVLT